MPEPVVVRPPEDDDEEPNPPLPVLEPELELEPPDDEDPPLLEDPPDEEPPELLPLPPPLPPPPPPPLRFHSSSVGEMSGLGLLASNVAITSRACDCGRALVNALSAT